MRMEQGVRTGLGHGGITCVLQTQFSSCYLHLTFVFLFGILRLFQEHLTFFSRPFFKGGPQPECPTLSFHNQTIVIRVLLIKKPVLET